MRLKTKRMIVLVTGLIGIFMIFILPFFLPPSLANDTTFCIIYFILFLSVVVFTNYTSDKIENMSIVDKREQSLKDILK